MKNGKNPRLATLLLASCCLMSTAIFAQATSASAPTPDQPTDELVPPTSASDFTSSQLDSVLAGSWRSEANRARDAYRHPKSTLQFFEVRPDQTLIEITPGSGWYSEILGPLLKGVSRSFYLTLRILPTGMRDPIGLAYLLARAADTIADTSLIPPEQRLELLLSLQAQVNGASDEGAFLRRMSVEVAGQQ